MKKQLITAVLATSFAGASMAADTGYYAGANIGGSQHDVAGPGELRESPTTWGVYGGYDFNPYVATEIGYQDLGKARSGSYEAKNRAFSADLVGKLPLNEQFRLFGKVGYAYLDRDTSGPGFDASQSGSAAKLGVGAEYAVMQNVGIRAEAVRYLGGPRQQTPGGEFGANTNVYTVGVNYRF
jgi:OmpA-OmpF porin, OOP family